MEESTKKKILIIEDERSMARALELKLTHEGFKVATANDGAAGLALIDQGPFDLILLDLVMPKMDGFSVLEALQVKHNTIPVIVSSNLSQPEDEQRAKTLGAAGFIIKSNTPIATIIELIKAQLSA